MSATEGAFGEFLMRDKVYRELAAKAAKMSVARSALPAGSTRARVTTANARWARAAEARDARERFLREGWDARSLPCAGVGGSDGKR